MGRIVLGLLMALTVVLTAHAENNTDNGSTAREMQYMPHYDVVVCQNGNNRYTRALYGATSAYRLETSDRPVFALFQDSRNCRNISFKVTYK